MKLINDHWVKLIHYRFVFFFGGCLWCCINGNHQNSHYKCNFPHFFSVWIVKLNRIILFFLLLKLCTHSTNELLTNRFVYTISDYSSCLSHKMFFCYRQFFFNFYTISHEIVCTRFWVHKLRWCKFKQHR